MAPCFGGGLPPSAAVVGSLCVRVCVCVCAGAHVINTPLVCLVSVRACVRACVCVCACVRAGTGEREGAIFLRYNGVVVSMLISCVRLATPCCVVTGLFSAYLYTMCLCMCVRVCVLVSRYTQLARYTGAKRAKVNKLIPVCVVCLCA